MIMIRRTRTPLMMYMTLVDADVSDFPSSVGPFSVVVLIGMILSMSMLISGIVYVGRRVGFGFTTPPFSTRHCLSGSYESF